MRGASGTRVTLGVIRVGWKEAHPFVVVRAQVKRPSVRSHVIEPRIGYLAIARFAEATSNDTAVALRELRSHDALDVLVLDLRDDPGGLVDQAVATADLFVDRGTIVSIHGRRGAIETQVAHAGGIAENVPIIALVDPAPRAPPRSSPPRCTTTGARSSSACRPTARARFRHSSISTTARA